MIKAKIRKIRRVLMDALNFLYFNNISLFGFFKNKQLSYVPYKQTSIYNS